MEVNTLECGTKQITLEHNESYEVLFLNEEGLEVANAYNYLDKIVFQQTDYDEKNYRKTRFSCSANLIRKEDLSTES